MNLGLITQDFPPEIGGIETYTTELAWRFARDCEHFFVIAPYKPDAPQVDKELPYRVHRIFSSNPFLGIRSMVEVPQLFYNHSIANIFHTQWQTLPASIFARRMGVINKIFVAAHARELLFNPFHDIPGARQAYEKYKRWLLSQVDLFFPVSAYTAEILNNHGIEKHRIKVVINGTDPVQFHPGDSQLARNSLDVDTSKNVMLTITRLVSRKGIDVALKAFKKVLALFPSSCYLIVGDGEQKQQLEALAEKLSIADNVQFVGRVAHHNLITYYHACDIFIMPSKTELPNVEGFGLVFLEANACEKPVIGTFSGGIPSAIVHEQTGLLVNENDIDALADAIQLLLSNRELAKSMGKKGRKRVKAKANWNAVAEELLVHMNREVR